MINEPGFEAARAQRAKIAGTSSVLDSRVEIWCARTGVDPQLTRCALLTGRTVRFRLPDKTGALRVAHCITPDQVA